MNKILKSDKALVEISNIGGEIKSFKNLKDGKEYMWNGDKKYWNNSAPTLFPLVCGSINNEIIINGKRYSASNHGFARNNKFNLIEETENSATYLLSYNDETLKIYPFKFNLFIKYRLTGYKLNINYIVENIGDEKMYFQLGAHPGFKCPLNEEETFDDYYLEFEKKETLERFYYDKNNLLIPGVSKKILNNEKILNLNYEMFSKGALIFKNIKSRFISLKSRKSNKKVVVSFDKFPYLGIWQPKGAPFVCIEPWHGIADKNDFNGELKDKEMIITLNKNSLYSCNYSIKIN